MICHILTKLQASRAARVVCAVAVPLLSAVVVISKSATAAGAALLVLTIAATAFHGPALLVNFEDDSD